MTTYVFDASTLLRLTDREAGFARVRDLLNAAARGEVELLMSSVNWGEVVLILHKKNDPAKARVLTSHLATLPITIVTVDKDSAEEAALFKHAFKVPYADAFAGSLTQAASRPPNRPATLVTADYDFKVLPKNTIKIEFLPLK